MKLLKMFAESCLKLAFRSASSWHAEKIRFGVFFVWSSMKLPILKLIFYLYPLTTSLKLSPPSGGQPLVQG